MTENILFRTLMDEHLSNMELVIKNSLYRFKAIALTMDSDFLDDFEEKTVDRVNQVCQHFKSILQNAPSSSRASALATKSSETKAMPRNIAKRQSNIEPTATRSKIVKKSEAEILTEISEDESSSSNDSGPESENIGKKYICIVGIHDSLMQDERKLREPFKKLCQVLGVPVLDKDIEKIYSNKRVTPHSLIVMLKRSDVRKQITRRSKKINISPNLNVISGNKNANKITIGPYKIPGWTQKSYTAKPKAKEKCPRAKPRSRRN
ncbi:uncharacterized protein LOC129568082 isoform X2 [Sitodiplosis mosellana]|uniref:uncharacterized protein LOC129568082 isoform X2 n=1 Tax=Sitodiplosis mosellana TaxID=263140 RepID=UPI0024437919|nr:uncharacterized protein LOC129568082 isoform X2 [Sitodiplosis mosellana]XP_055301604.1 uncharacterized protein LOC129568082 isoform X2 [Sitodiplosis mosellana]